MKQVIVEAIQKHRILQFGYKGGIRNVEPLSYGVNRLGHEVLRAFQIDGASSSGHSAGWKMFLVEEISDLKMNREVFRHAPPDFNPVDPDLVETFAVFSSDTEQ